MSTTSPSITPALVLVCGSRSWTARAPIAAALARAQADGFTHVVHGDARGADRMAGHAARRLGMRVVAVPADWDRFGLSAGFIRNGCMLNLRPQLVLAFARHLPHSHGTAHMVRIARAAGVPVRVFNA